jgi:NAD(P)-dependent dehydrogenase (short-subunit alcohol dehydrogenase family)
MRFAGKTVVVTGASSGIGLATARRLLGEGARVLAVGRSEERLKAAMANEPAQAFTYALDLSEEASVKAWAERLRAEMIEVHAIVHAAGVHALRPLKLLSSDELNRMHHSHVVSTVALLRHLAGTRVWSSAGGSAVVVSSVAALRGGAGTIAYAAAKAGLLAAMRCIATELSSRGLRVNAVSPGVVLTPQSEAFLGGLPPEKRAAIEAEHPLGLGRPEDVAAAITFLISEDSRWITGANLVIDGGLTLQ